MQGKQINRNMKNIILEGKILKRRGILSIIAVLCILLTGCSGIFRFVRDSVDPDNPLAGKSTDERIIMCLEQTYPEHTFHTAEPFDKSTGCGTFSDEKGIEFTVGNLTYNNVYHFGCRDDYLKTILEEQNYISQVSDIAEKYHLDLSYDELRVSVEPDDKIEISQYAIAILEILNCADTPEINWPKEQGFSTGEVNYYTVPNWGTLICICTSGESASGERFMFSDKARPVSEIEERLNDCYLSIK